MPGQRVPSSRWVFKDGKLLMFEGKDVLVLRGWPCSAAWLRRDGGPWYGARPRFQLVQQIHSAARRGYAARRMQRFRRRQREERTPLMEPDHAGELAELRARLLAGWERRHRAARAFIDSFPPGVLPLVIDLPERQWHMVQLLAHCPGAVDLAASNRGLAVALASSWAFHTPAVQRPLRAARSLLRGRRPAIAGWLGFPATRSAVSVLGKLRTDALTVERLRWLRSTLLEPDPAKELQHLPVLTVPALRVICDPELRRSAAHSLLEELALGPDSRDRKSAPYTLRDLLDAAKLVGLRTAPVVRSLAELHGWHDELVTQVNRLGLRELVGIEFPPVPVPGTDAIVPLATAREVVEEGRTMHHCVATYARRVAAGHTYLYRLLEPERATVSITRAATGPGWKVGQISGVANHTVGQATRLAVTAWLRASGQGWGPMYGPAPTVTELFGGDELPF